MTHQLLSIAFVLCCLGLPCAVPVTAQTSSWWYPLGNPQATRNNPAPTKSQTAAGLVVKWRTESLKNTGTLLVGALLPGTGQQIVGMTGDTLLFISENGLVVRQVEYRDSGAVYFGRPFSQLPFATSLCGLFNTAALTPQATGRPNVVGVGITRNQRTGTGQLADSLWSFLADPTGKAIYRLGIGLLPNDPVAENQIASVLPVAAFSIKNDLNDSLIPSAFTVVSQESFRPPSAAPYMANSVRRYQLSGFYPSQSARLQWSYGFAPKTYPQAPAITSIARPPVTTRYDNYIALSTNTYGFPLPVAVPPNLPSTTDTTKSEIPYSVSIRVNPDPRVLETRPTKYTALEVPGQANSYFVTLYEQDTLLAFRIMTENHDPGRPGTAQLTLARVEPVRVDNNGQLLNDGVFSDIQMKNTGWSIVTADLDGTAPGSVKSDSLNYPNNRGDEIVGAIASPNGTDLPANMLYVFRYNNLKGTLPRPFNMFAQQPFSGRLMAAGDLVADANGRHEIVTANGNTVTIWQLRDYDDDNLRQPRAFRQLTTLTLDADVTSVAIADIENDGENDLVVQTRMATYAVGLPQPKPLGTLAVDANSYCAGKSPVRLTWNRRVGGGEAGVRIVLRNVTTGDSVLLEQNYSTLNAYTAATVTWPAGTYRLILRDALVPSIADSTAAFTVVSPAIAQPNLAARIQVGETLRDTLSVACVDAITLQRSYNGTDWQTLPQADLQLRGNIARLNTLVECPPGAGCGADTLVTVYYRLKDAGNLAATVTDTVQVAVPMRRIVATPDTGSARERTITWAPADFSCSLLSFDLSFDGGLSWNTIGTAPASAGTFTLRIPQAVTGRASMRVCCASQTQSCDYAVRDKFFEVRLDDRNAIVPNPFNPKAPANVFCPEGAAVIFTPARTAPARIIIFDASRAVVRRLDDPATRLAGATYITCWDGKNSRGEIVANGTYICVIEQESAARIVLPVIIMTR